MSLTGKQQEVLVGTLLGDGCLEVNGNNPRLKIDHSLKQREYVDWKYQVFEGICTKQPYQVDAKDKRTGKIYSHFRFSTKSLPILWKYHKKFYDNGKRVISHEMINLLKAPLSLAVWFMDDGYRRNDCRAFRLNTQSYSYSEQEKLVRILKQNFNVNARIHKVKEDIFTLYLPVTEASKLQKLIEGFILPSMKYKLL